MEVTTSKIIIDDGKYIIVRPLIEGLPNIIEKQRKVKLFLINGEFYKLDNRSSKKGFNYNKGIFNTN